MKPSHTLLSFVASICLATAARAHPGHDGHELTWEFAGTHIHLEWIVGALVVAGAAVAVYRYVKSRG